jgi:hypothetical protein
MRRPLLALLAVTLLACNKSKPSDDQAGASAPSLPGLPGLGAFLDGFEGEIDALVKENKPGATDTALAVFVKSGKLRLDLPEKMAQGAAAMLGPKAYVVYDPPAKKIFLVADARKEVIVVDLEKSGEQLKGMKPPEAPHEPRAAAPEKPAPKLTKTGKFETVAGYKCENWDIATDHREGTVCVAQEGVSWFSIPMTGIPTDRAWMFELLDGKHFPLRFVGYDKDGATETARFEVTKIDKKALPASDFEYPPTYRITDLAQMFAGMAGMPGMPGRPGMPGLPSGMPPMPSMPPGHR